jgi:hypothetical protein
MDLRMTRSALILSLIGTAASVSAAACASQEQSLDAAKPGDAVPSPSTNVATDAAAPTPDASASGNFPSRELGDEFSKIPINQFIFLNPTRSIGAVRICLLEADGSVVAKFPFPDSRNMPETNILGIEPGGAAYIPNAQSNYRLGAADFKTATKFAILDASAVGRDARCSATLIKQAKRFEVDLAGNIGDASSGLFYLSAESDADKTPLVGFRKLQAFEFEKDAKPGLSLAFLSIPQALPSTAELHITKDPTKPGVDAPPPAKINLGSDSMVTYTKIFDGAFNAEKAYKTFFDVLEASPLEGEPVKPKFSQRMSDTARLYSTSIPASKYFSLPVPYVAIEVENPSRDPSDSQLLVLPLRDPDAPVQLEEPDAGVDAEAVDSGPSPIDAGAPPKDSGRD